MSSQAKVVQGTAEELKELTENRSPVVWMKTGSSVNDKRFSDSYDVLDIL